MCMYTYGHISPCMHNTHIYTTIDLHAQTTLIYICIQSQINLHAQQSKPLACSTSRSATSRCAVMRVSMSTASCGISSSPALLMSLVRVCVCVCAFFGGVICFGVVFVLLYRCRGRAKVSMYGNAWMSYRCHPKKIKKEAPTESPRSTHTHIHIYII